jgi:hypothetical protein
MCPIINHYIDTNFLAKYVAVVGKFKIRIFHEILKITEGCVSDNTEIKWK